MRLQAGYHTLLECLNIKHCASLVQMSHFIYVGLLEHGGICMMSMMLLALDKGLRQLRLMRSQRCESQASFQHLTIGLLLTHMLAGARLALPCHPHRIIVTLLGGQPVQRLLVILAMSGEVLPTMLRLDPHGA